VDILVTGASGVVGTEVCEQLTRAGHRPVRVARRPPAEPGWVAWEMAAQPPPEQLRRGWDVVIHTAASTRWTMTRDEAVLSNVDTLRAALELAGRRARLVHVSTAYVRQDGAGVAEFDGYRNGYEWSKARCEQLLADRDGPTVIVRPPLILGRSTDGSIARFTGPYTLMQSLLSGMAPVIVGDPAGYAEVAGVDQVAAAVLDAALGAADRTVRVVAAGERCLRLAELVDGLFGSINSWRARAGLEPVPAPPYLPLDSWHRFFLPLARTHLSPIQLEAVQLMGMFEAYTSMTEPFAPTWPVPDPGAVVARSVEHWIAAKPRLARRTPQPWSLVS
jgi:nucleoside-diphosphate-sugar epimerase